MQKPITSQVLKTKGVFFFNLNYEKNSFTKECILPLYWCFPHLRFQELCSRANRFGAQGPDLILSNSGCELKACCPQHVLPPLPTGMLSVARPENHWSWTVHREIPVEQCLPHSKLFWNKRSRLAKAEISRISQKLFLKLTVNFHCGCPFGPGKHCDQALTMFQSQTESQHFDWEHFLLFWNERHLVDATLIGEVYLLEMKKLILDGL